MELQKFYMGEAFDAYEYFGAHTSERDGRAGVVFRIWAPNAESVSVLGDFNDWNKIRKREARADVQILHLRK